MVRRAGISVGRVGISVRRAAGISIGISIGRARISILRAMESVVLNILLESIILNTITLARWRWLIW
jgi:hypothetical protein